MNMDISIPNEYGCLEVGCTEVVTKLGPSSAEVNIALSEDGRYRYSVSVKYSYGGFGGPVTADGESFADVQAARTAGMEELLHRWPKALPTDPSSVHDELRLMREQIESQLQQPSLF
jgi:hypothetical protein